MSRHAVAQRDATLFDTRGRKKARTRRACRWAAGGQAVDAILTGRQVGGRLIVIAYVVLVVVHPGLPKITVASRSSVDTRRALVPSNR